MRLKCPVCELPLFENNGQFQCDDGHLVKVKYGVHILQEPSFAKWYGPFENKFQAYREREGLKIKDASAYNKLPHVPNNLGKAFWNAKAQDLMLTKEYLAGKSNLNILEVGAWNCWLTNHLCQMGHSVIAVDYFIDPYDGLGAIQHYSKADWNAIQMNLERLDLIDEKFDLIIVNRMVVYFEDPFETLKKLINENLSEKGEMLVTGVIMTTDKKITEERFNKEMEDFEKKEGFSLKIKEFYGAFTQIELNKVIQMGFNVHQYPKNVLAYLKQLIKPKRRSSVYFTFQKNNRN